MFMDIPDDLDVIARSQCHPLIGAPGEGVDKAAQLISHDDGRLAPLTAPAEVEDIALVDLRPVAILDARRLQSTPSR